MEINNIGSKDILSKKQEYNIMLEVYQMQVDNDDTKNANKYIVENHKI